MGEVLCITKGDENKIIEWVQGKPDRYVVWVDLQTAPSHPRILAIPDDDLSFKQVAEELLYLPFDYQDGADPSLQRLCQIQTEIHCRASDYLDQGVRLLVNFKAHLQRPTRCASDCEGQLSEYPFVVCGAGPSLQEIIPLLKQHHDRWVIVGCGAGMQALLAAGIKPHLAVQVDPNPHHHFSKTDIPLFYQLRTSHAVTSQMTGPRFLMAGAGEFPLERWIESKFGIETAVNGGWTAATRGAALAKALGAQQILLAGIDFSTTTTLYAKGVKESAEHALLSITLNNGTTVRTRADWLMAAKWLNEWALQHPDIQWGVCGPQNLLMPQIPSVDLKTQLGPEGSSQRVKEIFVQCKEQEGKEIWEEIQTSFKRCRELCIQFLSRFQKVFPQLPTSDQECRAILNKINQTPIVSLVGDPIWNYWEWVLKRESDPQVDSLIIHRILLLQSLSDQFYA